MMMLHPGLDDIYALVLIGAIMMINAWVLFSSAPSSSQEWRLSLGQLPVIRPFFMYLINHT